MSLRHSAYEMTTGALRLAKLQRYCAKLASSAVSKVPELRGASCKCVRTLDSDGRRGARSEIAWHSSGSLPRPMIATLYPFACMKTYFSILVVILLSFLTSGCSSIMTRIESYKESCCEDSNFPLTTPVYCGTSYDFGTSRDFGFPFFYLDIPFSFALDTILLPADLLGAKQQNRTKCKAKPLRIIG